MSEIHKNTRGLLVSPIRNTIRSLITIHLVLTFLSSNSNACQKDQSDPRRQTIPAHKIQTEPVRPLVKYDPKPPRGSKNRPNHSAAKKLKPIIDPNCIPTNKWQSSVSPGWCARNCLDGCGKTNCEQICIDRKAKKAYDDLVAERGPSCMPTRRWSKHVSAKDCLTLRRVNAGRLPAGNWRVI